MLCGALAAQSQAAGAYKYVLNQYKAVKAQIAPWVEQFQAQHGRSPCSTDAEASGRPANTHLPLPQHVGPEPATTKAS